MDVFVNNVSAGNVNETIDDWSSFGYVHLFAKNETANDPVNGIKKSAFFISSEALSDDLIGQWMSQMSSRYQIGIVNYTLTVLPAEIAYEGQDVTLEYSEVVDYTLTVLSAEIAYEGQDTGLLHNRVLEVTAAETAYEEQETTLLYNRVLEVTAAETAYEGQDVTLTYSGGGDGSLQSVVSSCCYDLDSTQTDSYGGTGQTWANLVESPADGANQTDFDVYLGADGTASTEDPTFTSGSPDHFLHDGGDYFIGKNSPPGIINDMHKTTSGNAWWSLIAAKTASTVEGTDFLLQTYNGDTESTGIMIQYDGDSKIQVMQKVDNTNVTQLSTATISPSTDTVIIVSYDKDTDKMRFWINGGTAEEYTVIFNTTTTDAQQPAAAFMAANSGVLCVPDGWQTRTIAGGNSFLTDSDVSSLITELNTRHGVTYD
jgi:hypothetical protein